MSTSIQEGQLTFHFPTGWQIAKYDAWLFYREQFQGCRPGVKAIDILAIEPNQTTWLIEVKDFRHHPRKKPSEILDEITAKICDSLAGLVSAKFRAIQSDEKTFAAQALNAHQLKVVLHLEQVSHPHRHNTTQFDLVSLQQKLRKRLAAIDPSAKIMNKDNCGKWTVV